MIEQERTGGGCKGPFETHFILSSFCTADNHSQRWEEITEFTPSEETIQIGIISNNQFAYTAHVKSTEQAEDMLSGQRSNIKNVSSQNIFASLSDDDAQDSIILNDNSSVLGECF